MKNVIDFLNANPWIYAVIYEVIVRLIPTASKYYSIIEIINKLWPNLKKGGGFHLLIFSLISFSAIGQQNINARSVRWTPQDTATFVSTCVCTLSRGLSIRQTDTDSIYIYNGLHIDSAGRHWNLLNGGGSGGGGNVNFANNGVSLSGDTVQLGGTLTKNTTIDASDKEVTFNNVKKLDIELPTGALTVTKRFSQFANYSNTANNQGQILIDTLGYVQANSNSKENAIAAITIGRDNQLSDLDGGITLSTGESSYSKRLTIDSLGNIDAPNTNVFSMNSVSFDISQQDLSFSNVSGGKYSSLASLTSVGTGTLSAGSTDFSGELNVDESGVTIYGNRSDIRLKTSSLLGDINYVVIDSIGNITVLPNGNTGTNGQALTTDGTGKLSYTSITATPAGANTQIQYNNSGAFGASSKFTWDNTNASLNINGGGSSNSVLSGSNVDLLLGSYSSTAGITFRQFGTGAFTWNKSSTSNYVQLSEGSNIWDLFADHTSTTKTDLRIRGSNHSTNGGELILLGGSAASSGGGNGGNVTIGAGNKDGAGTQGSIKIGGSSDFIGFYNVTPALQGAVGTTLVNNVTSGGTTGTIADFTSLTVYATDAATIRNDIYQLALKLATLEAKLKLLGAVKD